MTRPFVIVETPRGVRIILFPCIPVEAATEWLAWVDQLPGVGS